MLISTFLLFLQKKVAQTMKKYPVLGKQDTRSGFGAGLLEVGKANPNVVALCADLTGSLKMDAFAKEFPERFVQVALQRRT